MYLDIQISVVALIPEYARVKLNTYDMYITACEVIASHILYAYNMENVQTSSRSSRVDRYPKYV